MNDEEFNDFLVALNMVEEPRYSQKCSTIVASLTNQLAKIFYTANVSL